MDSRREDKYTLEDGRIVGGDVMSNDIFEFLNNVRLPTLNKFITILDLLDMFHDYQDRNYKYSHRIDSDDMIQFICDMNPLLNRPLYVYDSSNNNGGDTLVLVTNPITENS